MFSCQRKSLVKMFVTSTLLGLISCGLVMTRFLSRLTTTFASVVLHSPRLFRKLHFASSVSSIFVVVSDLCRFFLLCSFMSSMPTHISLMSVWHFATPRSWFLFRRLALISVVRFASEYHSVCLGWN